MLITMARTSITAVFATVRSSCSCPSGPKGAQQPALRQFFVSPAGNDANPGTQEKPFASPMRGRRMWSGSSSHPAYRGNVIVIIRQGVYELSEPLVFGPEDSGSEQFAVTYAAQPDETVILSGGRKISGWKHREGDIWTAAVPGVAEGKWYFRNLFVHGKRAIRAQHPIRMPNRTASSSGRRTEQGLDSFHADGGPGGAR